MNIKDFKVGQTVYVELTGNACRGKTDEQCIEEWEITSVGRKYIKARKKSDRKILTEITFEYRENYRRFVQKTEYCVDYILYPTRKEVERKFERRKLITEVRSFFLDFCRFNTLSNEQLKKIVDIIEEVAE